MYKSWPFSRLGNGKRCNTWKEPGCGTCKNQQHQLKSTPYLFTTGLNSGETRERARRMSTLGSGLIDWQAQDVGVKDTALYFREFLEHDA